MKPIKKPIKNWKARKRVDGKGTPNNKERAYSAEKVLLYYDEAKEDSREDFGSSDSVLIDLLSDLCHYAASQGIEPERILRMASYNFEDER